MPAITAQVYVTLDDGTVLHNGTATVDADDPQPWMTLGADVVSAMRDARQVYDELREAAAEQEASDQ